MKIKILHHFKRRIKQRARNEHEVMHTFRKWIKLVKKKKIRPTQTISNNRIAYKLAYEYCTFIYTKNKNEYILITFYQRWDK